MSLIWIFLTFISMKMHEILDVWSLWGKQENRTSHTDKSKWLIEPPSEISSSARPPQQLGQWMPMDANGCQWMSNVSMLFPWNTSCVCQLQKQLNGAENRDSHVQDTKRLPINLRCNEKHHLWKSLGWRLQYGNVAAQELPEWYTMYQLRSWEWRVACAGKKVFLMFLYLLGNDYSLIWCLERRCLTQSKRHIQLQNAPFQNNDSH